MLGHFIFKLSEMFCTKRYTICKSYLQMTYLELGLKLITAIHSVMENMIKHRSALHKIGPRPLYALCRGLKISKVRLNVKYKFRSE